MSVTKDGDTGRWMSQIRVTDWTGKTIRKKKRGFATKKEALQWERDFIMCCWKPLRQSLTALPPPLIGEARQVLRSRKHLAPVNPGT